MIRRGPIVIWEDPRGWRAEFSAAGFRTVVELDSADNESTARHRLAARLATWAREAQEAAALLVD